MGKNFESSNILFKARNICNIASDYSNIINETNSENRIKFNLLSSDNKTVSGATVSNLTNSEKVKLGKDHLFKNYINISVYIPDKFECYDKEFCLSKTVRNFYLKKFGLDLLRHKDLWFAFIILHELGHIDYSFETNKYKGDKVKYFIPKLEKYENFKFKILTKFYQPNDAYIRLRSEMKASEFAAKIIHENYNKIINILNN